MIAMQRRQFLQSIAAASLVGCAAPAPESVGRRTPNIVFLMADDLGYGHLGCYGQERIRTPRIDRLAAEGMRFTDCYAGSTVCAPSRSTLMTGFHTGHAHVRANTGGVPLRPGDVTVAEVLKAAGYATGLFGKWGLGAEGTTGVPTRQGFDEFFGYLHQIHAHFYYPEYLMEGENRFPLPGNVDGARGQYSHDLVVERALDFIERRKDEPFFLYVPFTIPHAETLVPEDSLAEYRGEFPETPYEGSHYADQPTPNAAFAGMVSRLDRDVGRLVDRIDEFGLGDDTIIFFTSDNGSISGFNIDDEVFHGSGPLRGFKRDVYEGGIRTPMIARWTGTVEAGAVSDLPWAFWDFLPTAAELAGGTVPEGIDGISVVPTLTGESEQRRHDYLYWEFEQRERWGRAVRMGQWKAVEPARDAPLELYDLEADPGEAHDVADEHPNVTERMRAILVEAHTEPAPQVEPGWDG